jgi:hypothetical protein
MPFSLSLVKMALFVIKMKGGINMPKGEGVSGHTHTQEQLDNYANQNNPNNDAYQADLDNHADQLNPNNDKYQDKDED